MLWIHGATGKFIFQTNSLVLKTKNQFIVGTRPVIEAITAGKEINKILFRKGLRGENTGELFTLVRNSGIPYQFVPLEKLNRLHHGNHQGVIAILSAIEYKELAEIVQRCYEEGRDPFIIVLDQLTDVRNFGAIARTAECAGADAIVIPGKGSVSITADSMKTSAGALNRIAVSRSADLTATVKDLIASGLRIVAASEKATDNYFNISLTGPVALVVGSEEKGIHSEILKVANHLVKIPMRGSVESLNVSVACGILAFEIVKQRLASIDF